MNIQCVLRKMWGTVVVYLLFILLFLFAVKSESLDLFCPSECKSYNPSVCGDGKSKLYAQGTVNPNDSLQVLLNKTEHVLTTNNRLVKWRRAFILAFIIIVFISLLVLQQAMSAPQFVLAFSIVFVPLYFSQTYHHQHFDRFSQEKGIQAIQLLREKLSLQAHPITVI